ncbi:MAG: hypothetical protein IKV34_01955 [Clostridia bacterium]|nr:hypothetical protein [Clostridia bacterium]
MFYKKRLATPKTKTFYFAFNDFSGGMGGKKYGKISAKYADVCFNTDGEYGAFKQGFGFDQPWLNASVSFPQAKQIDSFCIDGQTFLALTNENDELVILSVQNPTGWQKIAKVKGKPKLMEFRQNQKVTLLVFDDDGLQTWDGNITTKINDTPVLSDVVLCYERVFGVDKNDKTLLRFSSCQNPNVWANENGNFDYIRLDDNFGEIKKLVVLKGDIFVFGKNKIAKLTATSSPQNFFAQTVFSLNESIFNGSICHCGGDVAFCVNDGIFLFNGNTITCVSRGFKNRFGKSEQIASCFFDGKYFLSCKFDFCDGRRIGCEKQEYKNNAVAIYDFAKDKIDFARGMDISCFVTAHDKLFFVADGKVGQISDSGLFFGNPLQKVWQTEYGDFGIVGKKVLKSVQLYSLSNVVLKIFADDKIYTFAINGKKSLQKIKLGISGNIFKICFEANCAKPFVFKPVFEIGYGG